MSENVGEIYYDVDAETGNLIIAQKDVERATKAMGDSFKRLESQQTKSSKAVSDGLANMGRKAGQAGIQIQQLVGQVTTGTSPLVAFSQQAADLGIVLGAPLLGAVIGIASALGTVLLPSLFKSTSATDAFKESLKQVDDVIKLSSSGVAEYTDELIKLATQSSELARIKLALTIEKVNESFRAGKQVFDEQLESLGDYDDAIEKITGVERKREEGSRRLTEEYIRARDAVYALNDAFKEVARNPTDASLQNIQYAIEDLTAAGAKSTKEGRELLNTAVDLFSKFKDGKGSIDAIKSSLDSMNLSLSDEAAKKTKDAIRELTEQLEITRTRISDGDVAAQKLALSFKLGLKTVELMPPEIAKLVDQINQIKAEEKFRTLSESLSDQIDKLAMTSAEYAQYNAIKQLGADATPDQIVQIEALTEALVRQQEEVKAAKDKAKQDEKDTQLLKTLGVSPEVMAQQETNRQLQELDRLKKEGDLASEEDYINRRNEIVRQGNEKLDKINETVKGIDWESFSNRAAGAFALVATGAQDGRDAIRGLAQSIATEAIGALVKMLYQSIIGQKTVASAGVAAAGALNTAYAPVASLVSLASFGANAGPAQAGISSTFALTNSLASSGRLNGGPVAAGRLYPVNEDGRPELLTQGNKQYLMPTSRGNVTSNKDLSAGSQPVININISTPPGMTSEVRQTQSGGAQDIDVTIRAVANDIEEGGQVYQAMQRRTRAGTRAS